jgi:hypothetical protein
VHEDDGERAETFGIEGPQVGFDLCSVERLDDPNDIARSTSDQLVSVNRCSSAFLDEFGPFDDTSLVYLDHLVVENVRLLDCQIKEFRSRLIAYPDDIAVAFRLHMTGGELAKDA